MVNGHLLGDHLLAMTSPSAVADDRLLTENENWGVTYIRDHKVVLLHKHQRPRAPTQLDQVLLAEFALSGLAIFTVVGAVLCSHHIVQCIEHIFEVLVHRGVPLIGQLLKLIAHDRGLMFLLLAFVFLMLGFLDVLG